MSPPVLTVGGTGASAPPALFLRLLHSFGSSMLCRATILRAGDYILISSHDIACEDTQSR